MEHFVGREIKLPRDFVFLEKQVECYTGVKISQSTLKRLWGYVSCDMMRVIVEKPGDQKIGAFQAFAVSLSSRVGTGNLAGVASAIFVGGPGAVFWMWVMALFGAAKAFVEATLAQLYKRRGEDSFYGGPAYYMQYGLHRKWMGVLFAILITITFGMANQVIQSNTLCDALADSLAIDAKWIGVTITIATLIIIFGGIRRISHFASLVVPFMAIGYGIMREIPSRQFVV